MEQTISDLQSQIERLSTALERWQHAEQQLQPLEERLSQLSDRGSEILNRLATADERNTLAVTEVEARLTQWNSFENQLHQDSLERVRALERTIEQEWKSLRDMHEEPLKLLREQAAALGETCVAAANLSLRGYERAEARLAALENDLRAQLSQLSRDVHAALTEVRREGSGPAALPPPPQAAPFPLDRVMRIHEDLREPDRGPGEVALSVPVPSAVAIVDEKARALPAATVALTERVDVLEREMSQEKQEVRETAARADRLSRQTSRTGVAFLVAGVVLAAVLGYWLQQRLADAAIRASAAERQAATVAAEASREIASARAETAEARDVAARADLTSGVLTAPDLIRFWLIGEGDAASARGQIMWSRSHGLVMSASRLPPLPSGSTYQVWLLTPDASIRAGQAATDAEGRASLVTDNPSPLPRPVDGVAVTLEPPGSSGPVPLGPRVMTRRPASP